MASDGGFTQTETNVSPRPKQDAEQPTDDQEDSATGLPVDMNYQYEELRSRPYTTPDSDIPENLLNFSHSFGYDCGRRANLQLLDEDTLAFIAGNVLVMLDIPTKHQRYLRSCSGGGIGAIMAHPTKQYFAVAEKGHQPYIVVYGYPSLLPYRILRGGTARAYSYVDFNPDGSLLASVGGAPDYMLTLWDWRQERVMLHCRAFSQEVYRVSFSPENPAHLTSSGSGHIKFWKMTSTFTGIKLEGLVGMFEKTSFTDVESYVELPDGKVVSGSKWGNMLVWDGGLIKVEVCRKEKKPCHAGTIQQFSLDKGELMSFGEDGAIRTWDFEILNTATAGDASGLFEMEPMNELLVGGDAGLCSLVRSSVPDSTLWFAQDSKGGIWKLDLSFSNISEEPQRLCSCHAGAIQGMGISGASHLMATTALDGSVRVFDFLANTEVTCSQFKQGGTALIWAPSLVNEKGSLLVAGFQDGVVRLLELCDPSRGPRTLGGGSDTELRLKQALKPHNSPVTAIAYKCNGEMLATGSAEGTVFFFGVGEEYKPVGFIEVPGPVQGLEWSPSSESDSTLLVFCRSGHVVEVRSPGSAVQDPAETYQLSGLPTRTFRFSSIKSRIQREEALARRQAEKEKRRLEREEQLRKAKEQGRAEEEVKEEEEEEENKEDLPSIFIPEPPSPLCCGFRSEPGTFWLSMGGYDSGFLYHCRFSEGDPDPQEDRWDEPFAFLVVHDADDDPIHTVSFSPDQQLMLCGMQSGVLRAYPLPPGGDRRPLSSLGAYWALSLHDNQYGCLRHARLSHDGHHALTAGDDGNVFSLAVPTDDGAPGGQGLGGGPRADVPSPREETEGQAADIEDTAAYSIEVAKQRLDLDRVKQQAEASKVERRAEVAHLRSRFRELLRTNDGLPEHVRLPRTEFEDKRMCDLMKRQRAEQTAAAWRELAWEQELHNTALEKLQHWFRDSVSWDTLTVSAVDSEHRVSTYRLPARAVGRDPGVRGHAEVDGAQAGPGQSSTQARKESRSEPGKEPGRRDAAAERQNAPPLPAGPPGGSKMAGLQAERLQRAAEKAKRAQAQVDTWKQKWAQLYASKPDENSEDPADVLAIRRALETVGDFKLKTDQDYSVPEHLRMTADRKRAELVALERQVHGRKSEMNASVAALRDAKVRLVARLRRWARRLRRLHRRMPPRLRRPAPALPHLHPEEVPERRLRYSRSTLERYAGLRADGLTVQTQEVEGLEQLEQEMLTAEEEEGEDKSEEEEGGTPYPVVMSEDLPTPSVAEETELEKELRTEQEIRWTYEQDCVLEQMAEARALFDSDLRLLRHRKLELDCQVKRADLRHVTLFQELLLLQDFEGSQSPLQRRLQAHRDEESRLTEQLDRCDEQLEEKRENIGKLKESEKALVGDLQALLSQDHPFADFLTQVFKKKIKRTKNKEPLGEQEEEMDSDEEEDSEEEEEDSEEDDTDSNGSEAALDDSVCPPSCDPELFEKVLQMREQRLDLEEQLVEEKSSAAGLKKDYEALAKTVKVVQASVRAAVEQQELLSRGLQQRLNQLYVVVPLRLHQILFVSGGAVQSDLSGAVVLSRAAVPGLQARVQELRAEKQTQREQYRHARQQHVLLRQQMAHMEALLLEAEQRCTLKQVEKLGRRVDMEALPILVANMNLQQERSRMDTQLREAARARETKSWEAKLDEAQQALMEETRAHTERLVRMNSLVCQKRELEDLMKAKQKKKRGQFDSGGLREDLGTLRRLVRSQQEEAEALKREIHILSLKGGPVLPPHQPAPPTPAPPLAARGSFVGSVSPKAHRTVRRPLRAVDKGPSPGQPIRGGGAHRGY